MAKATREAPVFLARYLELLERLDETGEVRIENKNPRGIRTKKSRSARLGGNVMLEEEVTYTDPAKQPSITLECDNTDYYFDLGKAGASASFALTRYAQGERKLPLWKRAGGIHNELYYHLKDAIEALALTKRANLRKVRFDAKTGLLSIDYELVSGKARIKHQVQFDPAKSWSLHSRRTETPYLFYTAEYTYGSVIDGLHLPSGATSSTTSKPGGPPTPTRIVSRVLAVKRTELSPGDFRLSAFGLPEPVDVAVRPKPTPWYYWLLGAAGVCGFFSLGFAYLRRRLEARRVATTKNKDGP